MIRILLVLYFIGASIRYRVAPWRFFQLNGDYFDEDKGLFSKLDIDQVIPRRWYLQQIADDGEYIPPAYPVFVKPEWGQNSYAVSRVDDIRGLTEIRKRNTRIKIGFIIQEAALESNEYEMFYIRSATDNKNFEVFSITEVIHQGQERHPINGIHNPLSRYVERTQEFSEKEQETLWNYLAEMGDFRIARVGVRADSPVDLLAGNFHVIEINIYLPMPLYLLDADIDWRAKHAFIVNSMAAAARLVGTIPSEQKIKRIFFRKLFIHYRIKS